MSLCVYEEQLAELYRRRAQLDAAIKAFEAYGRGARDQRRRPPAAGRKPEPGAGAAARLGR